MDGGRCLITYFLLNEGSLRCIDSGHSTLPFQHVFQHYRTVSQEIPEQTITFDENWIASLYNRIGLRIVRLEYGSWYGRDHCWCYQDLILAVRA
jgi:hypothetical protein